MQAVGGANGGGDVFGGGEFIGASGFKNVKPRTRAERLAKMDKESLEKGRLKSRFGGTYARETRNQDFPGKQDSHTSCAPGGAGYCASDERFICGGFDIATEFKHAHDRRIMRSEMNRDHRREATAQREETRWNRLQQQAEDEKAKWERYRQEGLKAKRNKGSTAFDLVTLDYCPGQAGEAQRGQDQVVRYRSALRAQHLHHRMNAAGYNPITGADTPDFVLPEKPKQDIQPHVYNPTGY